jgi:hypothetical protein
LDDVADAREKILRIGDAEQRHIAVKALPLVGCRWTVRRHGIALRADVAVSNSPAGA